MRLIQRLATNMCEARWEALRQQRRGISDETKRRPWEKVPKGVRALLTRAAGLKDEMGPTEAAVTRKGYTFQSYGRRKQVRGQEPVHYRDASKREKAMEAKVDARLAAIRRRKEQALRDTLGMSEKQGKAYLDR